MGGGVTSTRWTAVTLVLSAGSETGVDWDSMFPCPGGDVGTIARERLELPERDEFKGATGTTGGVVVFPVTSSSVVLPDRAGIVRPR